MSADRPSRAEVTDRLYSDSEYREEVCAWLRALGLDPGLVPIGAMPAVENGELTIQVNVRGEGGGVQKDPFQPYRALRTTVTVPITVPPPPAAAEWLAPRCPTCGR